MSRYDGGMNGLGTALWFLLLVTVFAALGAWVGEEYNAFALADLPNWVGTGRRRGGDDRGDRHVGGRCGGDLARRVSRRAHR